MTMADKLAVEVRTSVLNTDILEAELTCLLRRRVYAARAMAIAESFLDQAQGDYDIAETAYEAALAELTKRYELTAANVGVPDLAEPQAAATGPLKLED